MKKLVKDGTHRCDFGCDNDCDMDGMLYRFIVEDLEGTLDNIEREYNESL